MAGIDRVARGHLQFKTSIERSKYRPGRPGWRSPVFQRRRSVLRDVFHSEPGQALAGAALSCGVHARGVAGPRRKTGKLFQSCPSNRWFPAVIQSDNMKKEALFGLTLVMAFVAGGLTIFIVIQELPVQRTRTEPREFPVESIDWNATAEPLPEGVRTYIVGTTQDGEGTISSAWVRAEPGVGKILVDIENLFFWVDIQHSIRTASSFSKEYLEIERGEHDLTYSMDLDVSIIGGPSAGAPLTVATMAALKNSSIREDVVMTGTVEPDGRIGRVRGIIPKAKAVEGEGFNKFLVPEGQAVQITYTKQETCRDIRGFEICRTEYIEEELNVEDEVDIEVVEVAYIEDALEYFL